MPRRRNSVRPVSIFVRLHLWPGRDDDLIALLAGAPRRGRAEIVRQALRMSQASPARAGAKTEPESVFDEVSEVDEIDLTSLLL